ncbi:hypothetical protein BACPLE_02758 [Phocaeicola plebeius DSM 17135]|uniref:Uncharacterized protein n=1 Tax=Phocaeicola plebeius (strain DSM 17135 / JCM 12973 / CCUG 54634 / M2) TaxID=484018 RepID=B5D181_PHOPM|nr:hypothetical protein BACPLE_02758 [Phocaeicola plebeius DSM 17135]
MIKTLIQRYDLFLIRANGRRWGFSVSAFFVIGSCILSNVR